MDFRVFVEPQQGATYSDQLAVARAAEDLGYSALVTSLIARSNEADADPMDIINSIMTLVVFLPLLFTMSEFVGDLPVIGAIPHSLFWLALAWSVFGTTLLAVVGMKLPELQFRNQRVEAAFRKELVYGEDQSRLAIFS